MAPTESTWSLDQSTSEEDFAGQVDRIKVVPTEQQGERLADLLSERHPVFRGRTTNTMMRMRGYVMATFEQTGMPKRALPYVLEALESSFHPYMVAAAARALRGVPAPDPQTAPYLVNSIYNIWQRDEPVSFDSYHVEWPLEKFSTGLIEICTTLVWMGADARGVLPDLESLRDQYGHRLSKSAKVTLVSAIEGIQSTPRNVEGCCCKGIPASLLPRCSATGEEIEGRVQNLPLEDQDGNHLTWSDFFKGKPSVLAFFYTRCANPQKCTATIYNLGSVQRELQRSGLAARVRTAAITYDPEYDTALALKSYGDSRRFQFGSDHRMFRTPEGITQVVEALELGVNFAGSQVNQHRIEFFILDARGKIETKFLRLKTTPAQIIAELRRLLGGD